MADKAGGGEGKDAVTCPWKERVSHLADGELDGAAAEEVREHLAECDSCARWLGDVLQLEVLGERYLEDAYRKGALAEMEKMRRDGAEMMAEDAALRKSLGLTPGRDLILAAAAVVLSLGAFATALLSLWWS